MSTEENIRQRLKDLIERGQSLGHPMAKGDEHSACVAWLTAARNVVAIILPDPDALYRKYVDAIASFESGGNAAFRVDGVTELLRELLYDFNNGLLSSIVDQVRADLFDNFLDHARWYLDEKRPKEAGVIAGVVFEDTVRRICDNRSIEQTGRKLDELISDLTKVGVISGGVAKRARAAAHVRTKATHAQWDEFGLEDVQAAIALTDELVLKNLTG